MKKLGLKFVNELRNHIADNQEYKMNSNMIYQVDEYLLKGIYFEKIQDHGYFNCFIQPLIPPANYLSFSFGYRIKNPLNNGSLFLISEIENHLSILCDLLAEEFKEIAKIDMNKFCDVFTPHGALDYEHYYYIKYLNGKNGENNTVLKELEEIILKLNQQRVESNIRNNVEISILHRIDLIKVLQYEEIILLFSKWREESIALLKI